MDIIASFLKLGVTVPIAKVWLKELFTNVKKEDWMQDGGVADPAFKRSRLKPEVYRMTNGRVIVEDEQLNFLAVKTKL